MRPSEAAAREAIVLLALAAFNSGISLRCVEPMLPQLASDFGTSVSAASFIVTSFALAYAAAVLLQGPLGDRFGKLRVVTIGTALAGAASLGCAAAWDVSSLAAARFLMAIFASAPMALGMAYIGDVVAMEQRQATIARFVAGSIFGQTLGPLFGGVFADWAGWRSSFVALGAVFILGAAVLFVRTRRDWPPLGPGRFSPLAIHARLLARAPVRWLLGIGIAETFCFFGAYVFLGAFLHVRFDLSLTVIGLLLAGYGIGGLMYSAMVPWLLRSLGERGLVVAGGILGFIALLAIVLSDDWLYTVPCTISLGIAFYLVHNTVQTKATEVAPDARASALALYASAWAVGQALGAAAGGTAVAAIGYAPTIAAFGFGFAALGVWLRYNLWRLRPA
ncbi:MAG TPA: MFS transporter [Burkholderiales bacterium]|nr:MFS transporter [Burkholderiales bacterium]